MSNIRTRLITPSDDFTIAEIIRFNLKSLILMFPVQLTLIPNWNT